MNRHLDPTSFHEVGDLFPGEVEVLSVGPHVPVGEALRLMLSAGYSQVPVIDNGTVRGLFSFATLARVVATEPKFELHTLLVGDVMESVPFVTVRDSLHSVLPMLEEREAILVGSPSGLQAVATPTDALRYLYKLAKPFVLLGEIEKALRALITMRTPGALLSECIDNSIRKMYEEQQRQVPEKLDEMSFEDLRSLVISGKNWKYFEGTLGQNRALISSKLERIRVLRNQVLHFRSELSSLDQQDLVAMRDWLRDKAQTAQPSAPEDQDD
ncbi:MAG TPA: CBS domain-containing protein [Longimicrobium sp.]|jgi:CBS domain-containing protein